MLVVRDGYSWLKRMVIYNIHQISMNAIITSFNKAEVNQCTERCITTLHHKSFTPDQLNCFQRCTRNLSKLQPTIGRLRSDSEELSFRMGAL